MRIQDLEDLIHKAINRFSDEEFTFLFNTGKNELFMRDLISLEAQKIFLDNSNFQVMREHGANRQDLAILQGKNLYSILETKTWIHADFVHDSKFIQSNSQIKRAILRDLEKLKINSENSIFRHFVVFLYTIDVPKLSSLTKYGSSHLKGIRDMNSSSTLRHQALSNGQSFLNNFGDTKHLALKANSDYFLDALLLELP